MKRIEDLNYYELLDIDKDSTAKDIQDAYLFSITKYHPDSIASYGLLSDEQKKQMLERIEEAYKTLINEDKREYYDKNILNLKRDKTFYKKETKKDIKILKEKQKERSVRINGQVLKNIRELKGTTLEEISKKTKISLFYLKAIEEDNYKAFPAEIFLKGFLRSYAKYLGLDPEEIVRNYTSTTSQ